MGAIGDLGRGQLLAYAVALALAVFAAFRLFGGGDDGAAPAPVEIEAGADRRGGAAGGAAGGVHVHVAGAVRREGLYHLPAGARVGTAIDRAGGPRPAAELAGVNLAAELQDGQQVIVPRRGEAAALGSAATGATPAAGTSTSAAGAANAPVSLAQATPEQLDASVEGIGPVLAAAIIDYRDQNGGVASIEELREVHGIGDERLAALEEALVP